MIRVFAMLLLLAASGARGESDAVKFTAAGIVEFTNAYRLRDGARFAAAANLFQQACTNTSATATNYYWLGAAEFHRLLHALGSSETTNQLAAGIALDAAVDALTRAVKLDASHAESHALLGTLYGIKIGNNLLSAAWLGPRVQREFKQAIADGAENPRVQYLVGMSRFYTAVRPGSRREALTNLLAAEKLFEAEATAPPAPLEPRWGHDSCLTFIGLCYEKLGQRAAAEDYFRKALALHPQDGLAQEGLKPVAKGSGK